MKKQSLSFALVLTLIATAVLVSGCGVKPDTLDSPNPAEKKQFPSVYPQK